MIRAIVIAMGLLLTSLTPVAAQQNSCPVPSESGTLNVLTLNLLFSEYPRRAERLNAVADFVAQNNIQLIALQEVVGGRFDDLVAQRLRGTRVDGNTARELRNLLRQRGVECDLRTGFATGVPALYEVSNATLVCGCQFTGNRIVRLLTPANERVDLAGISIRLTRSVLMTRLDTASGSLNIYNTHLCSLCSQEERLRQAREAMSFIAQVESFVAADHVIFLGDFNNAMAEPVYTLVIESGFTDTYAALVEISFETALATGIDTSCTLGSAEHNIPLNAQGCTIGVSEIPDPLLGPVFPPARIDYIFDRGAWTIVDSLVVFNPLATDEESPSVSDHSGVLTLFGPPVD